MASSSGTPSLERVISEAFCAAAKVILESRIYAPTPRTHQEQAKGRAWFNLEVEEVEGASKALERWRREAGLPLVLEVFLQPWGAVPGGQQDKAETLLERWVVHYYPQLPDSPSHLSRSQLSRLNPSSVYKRLVITLRSLYTYVRVLPAYRMYRACKRQRGSNFTLGYRLHSTLLGAAAAAAPGARRMHSFKFGAVETPYGQLRISVDYQPASTVTILEQTTSPPPLPQIIADYVGSPREAAGGRAVGTPPLRRHTMSASASVRGRGGPSPPSQYQQQQQQQQQEGALPSPRQHAQPGSSPQSAAERPGGMPLRRSWSTSMRGASPHRAALTSQQSGELPSPASAAALDPAYGSAPQQVSLPAMLRTLSTSAGRHAVGSPAGRPPLAKPPRAASAASPMGPGPTLGRSHSAAPAVPPAAASAGSSLPLRGNRGSAPGLSLAAGEEEEEEEDDEEEEGCEGDSPCGSAGSGARQSSAPVSIPGRAGRRLRSSGDLWALQQAANAPKPLSAPAVSHMQTLQAAAGGAAGAAAGAAGQGLAAGAGDRASPRGGSAAAGQAQQRQQSPAAPRLPLMAAGGPAALGSESSGSAASSLFPTSCSPQLPFAFTPSAQSLSSFGTRGGMLDSVGRLDRVSPRLGRTFSGASNSSSASAPSATAAAHLQQQRLSGGSSGGGGGTSAVTGREVPASMALMRRPSWSSRSSTYHQLSGEASQQGVGYSVSPMQDATLESMMAASTPRQFSLNTGGHPSPLSLPSGTMGGGQLAGGRGGRGGGGPGGGGAPPLLTYPSYPSPELSGGLDEGDGLPFALDEASGPSPPFQPCSPQLVPPPSLPLPPAAEDLEQLPVSTPAGAAGSSLQLHDAAGQLPKAAARSTPGPALAAAVPAASVPAAVNTDAAVGAFVRLMQEAPPLRMHAARQAGRAGSVDLSALAGLRTPLPGSSSGSDSSAATCVSDGRSLSLQAGLRQFSRIKERLQQRGVLVAPLPGEP